MLVISPPSNEGRRYSHVAVGQTQLSAEAEHIEHVPALPKREMVKSMSNRQGSAWNFRYDVSGDV